MTSRPPRRLVARGRLPLGRICREVPSVTDRSAFLGPGAGSGRGRLQAPPQPWPCLTGLGGRAANPSPAWGPTATLPLPRSRRRPRSALGGQHPEPPQPPPSCRKHFSTRRGEADWPARIGLITSRLRAVDRGALRRPRFRGLYSGPSAAPIVGHGENPRARRVRGSAHSSCHAYRESKAQRVWAASSRKPLPLHP